MKNIALERIGEKIMRARKRAKMTRGKLARAVNCTVIEIEEIEWGKRDICLMKLAQIANALKFDASEILDELSGATEDVREYLIERENAKKHLNVQIELEWDKDCGLCMLVKIDGCKSYLCCRNSVDARRDMAGELANLLSQKKYAKCTIHLKTLTVDNRIMEEIAGKILEK